MSGGSLNYLYRRENRELQSCYEDLSAAYNILKEFPPCDATTDLAKLLLLIDKLEMEGGLLFTNLYKVLKAAEWYASADYGKENVQTALDAYQGDKPPCR